MSAPKTIFELVQICVGRNSVTKYGLDIATKRRPKPQKAHPNEMKKSPQ